MKNITISPESSSMTPLARLLSTTSGATIALIYFINLVLPGLEGHINGIIPFHSECSRLIHAMVCYQLCVPSYCCVSAHCMSAQFDYTFLY